ncbi:hypothetical protein C8Q76DRAFT_691246 [Earliella scabrosa]|nr:hypothetical protein C8Q76DRAFT_691246 [Earliella scabrosa]
MERVHANGDWTLLDPADTGELGERWGGRFTALYAVYEATLSSATRMPARELWEIIAEAQREGGRIRIVFWCTINLSPHDMQAGTICLSLALPRFITSEGAFDFAQFRQSLKQTLLIADKFNNLTQQLDTVASMRAQHVRPVCLGVHGLADVFILLGMPYTSGEARTIALEIFETFYTALLSWSCELADVQGACSTWTSSPGERGEHYVDMWPVDLDPEHGFEALRHLIARHGLRNSVLTSLPPMRWFPALHADSEAVDPHYSNVDTSTSTGFTYTQIHPRLVAALEEENLWTEELAREILAQRGSIKHVAGIPLSIKRVFRTLWEWNPATLVDMAAERAPFVDQSYLTQRVLQHRAWERGLKTALSFVQPPATRVAQPIVAAPTVFWSLPSAP